MRVVSDATLVMDVWVLHWLPREFTDDVVLLAMLAVLVKDEVGERPAKPLTIVIPGSVMGLEVFLFPAVYVQGIEMLCRTWD